MIVDPDKKTTHFGYQEVPVEDKSSLVNQVFGSVAPHYDLMNDLMSFGLHRVWKRFTLLHADIKPGQCLLDVAAGTGDLGKLLAEQVGLNGKVILTDINEAMLLTGRDRFIDAGLMGNVKWVQANAEQLPFHDNIFDCITIAFGLRNVTHKARALTSMYRAVKPGGRVLILEFSQANMPLLTQLYDFYSFNIIPKMGELIAKDRSSYQYLVESIRMHPNQETLAQIMRSAGFDEVEYFNLCGGIVALHKGYKY